MIKDTNILNYRIIIIDLTKMVDQANGGDELKLTVSDLDTFREITETKVKELMSV